MARVNLMPWREQLREERKMEFIGLLLGASIGAACIVSVIDFGFRGDIINQQARIDFLRREILVLDARTAQIDDLKVKWAQIESRMQVIQDLQDSRPVVVRVFSELMIALPAGVYFNGLQREENRLQIEGIAASNNEVAQLMRRLDDSEWFINPSLQQISAAIVDSDDSQAKAFSLWLLLKSPRRAEGL
jgi:type IV pilus assembly protein PilN